MFSDCAFISSFSQSLLAGFASQIAFLVFWLIYLHYNPLDSVKHHRYLLFILVGIWSIGDAVMNTLTSALISTIWTNQSEAAFGNFKLWQSAGYVFIFVAGVWLGFEAFNIIMIGLVAASALGVLILDIFVSPIEKHKDHHGLLN